MSRRTLGIATLLGHFEAGSPEWHAARARRFGASEIAAVMSFSPWQSPFSLYHLKAGNVAPEPDRREMEWGRDLEALIARRFAREHRDWQLSRCGLYVNLLRPYQCAQPDRRIRFGPRAYGCLEVKTDRYADDWGAPGSDDIPVYYRCQGMWQMDTFGWSECHFAVLITGVDYREYVLRWDAEEAEILRLAAVEFLGRIDRGEPPALDTHAATYRTVRALHPLIDDVDVEIEPELAREYRAALDALDEAEAAKSLAGARVLDAMGRARRAVCAKTRVAIRVPTKGGPPHLRPASTGKRKKEAAE